MEPELEVFPLVTGETIGIYNILFLVLGIASALFLAYSANRVMKYNDKNNNYGVNNNIYGAECRN